MPNVQKKVMSRVAIGGVERLERELPGQDMQRGHWRGPLEVLLDAFECFACTANDRGTSFT